MTAKLLEIKHFSNTVRRCSGGIQSSITSGAWSFAHSNFSDGVLQLGIRGGASKTLGPTITPRPS
eukprot:2264264-Rhodomonas_salina.1